MQVLSQSHEKYMRGMDAKTGKALEAIDHLKQSIIDILTTPVSSRIMRRDYGSRLFELVDKPIDRDLTLKYRRHYNYRRTTWKTLFRVANRNKKCTK